MKKLFSLLIFTLAALAVTAQYGRRSGTYLGLGVGFAKVYGPAAEESPSYSQGSLRVKSNPLAMAAIFSNYGKGAKFGMGLYAGISIGTAFSKRMHNNTGMSNRDGIEFKDFNMYADLRLGLQGVYKLPEKQVLAGIRYFYRANADGSRSYFSENDEACAIGVFGAYKKFGLELNYSSGAIPGFLVESNWNITELEFRYKVLVFDEENYALLAGFRAEHSKLRQTYYASSDKPVSNMLMLVVAMGINSK